MHLYLTALALLLAAAVPARAETLCTLLADARSGEILFEEGDCSARVTPASTFKLPLAVMGYDAGLLIGADRPVMAYRGGDPDWGGANWTRNTSPADWLRYSVLWYSRRLTHAMGAEALTRYARAFAYGNADFTGDAGYANGLDRAWIASSLQVSPREQLVFLGRLLDDDLPVSPRAMRLTRDIVERRTLGGWTFHGKTGAAYPRRADRSFDYARGWGWYVGWARKGDRTVVFARLTQARSRQEGSPGTLTGDGLLRDWADLVD